MAVILTNEEHRPVRSNQQEDARKEACKRAIFRKIREIEERVERVSNSNSQITQEEWDRITGPYETLLQYCSSFIRRYHVVGQELETVKEEMERLNSLIHINLF